MPVRLLRPQALVFLALFILSTSLCAQKFVPKKIAFVGAGANAAELLAASGLKPGAALGQPEMQAAAQKLIDTGLFSDVRFAFDGVELRYLLKPATNLEPVFYANFPWWDAAALNTAIAGKVPLFHGSIPPESGMQQEVVAALTELVKEKGVAATISSAPGKDAAGNDDGVEFAITAPPVQIGSVAFSGADGSWAATLNPIAQAAVGQDFSGATEATLATALRVVYHRQGYLDMAMTSYAHGEPQFTGGKVMVPVSATIVQGPQYHLSGLHLAGDVMMTPEEFAKDARIHPGDVANEDLLRETLAMVTAPYRSHGYLRAKINATPAFDPGNHTIDYSITVEPGPVFHMGQLVLKDLSDQQKAQMLEVWPLHAGDVYDAAMVPQFLNRYKSRLHALDGWSASHKAYEHDDSHIVDLVVTFRQGGPLN